MIYVGANYNLLHSKYISHGPHDFKEDLIVKLSISHFLMVMFLALHPMESISLNSFVLLEHQAILLTSSLAINC